ncbi:mechanosensitive ion channel-like protein [Halohasta litchfieldiae]|jgi:small-conductance mechanosensitive channel|uniref:Mechanosensitive ion channel n=1 Tax=Halohasta litchfieldiae TaxID=1073996 RepID=A0A1H6SR35_9EURY|nr:mechanosensitive ion channel family protein [Halohasta litchfieldiae]ATW89929.1 mechanosensitive ion channel-like protein [Halohasta litchfieldiae]SEI66520.1 Mechanosensitive ion channel [Halohasta litchfieldiae]
MVLPQSVDSLVPKYAALLGQLGELLVVAAVVYIPGRYLLEPAVAWLFGRRNMDPTIERALQKVLHVGVIVGTLAVAAAAAGFSGLLGGSALIVAALTLAVGFAAQDVISNFVAGVFIVQDRNFTIDDWIEWDDKAGFIDDIGFRVTRVRTFDNETITVPNTELATTSVTNRMSNDTLRISYKFGIGYADNIDETTRILLDVADDHDEILTDPEPSVRMADLGDTAVLLQARFWIGDPDREEFSETRSEYIQIVKDRCEAAGIDLSTTTQHDLSGKLTVDEPPTSLTSEQ